MYEFTLTNSIGTSYSNEESFTTNSTPTVETDTNVTDITASSATAVGNVISDNGESVTGRGVCWSTSENPTILTIILLMKVDQGFRF